MYKCQRAVTYLCLFQTPKGFKQVAQVTAHTIKVLRKEENIQIFCYKNGRYMFCQKKSNLARRENLVFPQVV